MVKILYIDEQMVKVILEVLRMRKEDYSKVSLSLSKMPIYQAILK
jgi:hypothetical protein